MNLSLRLQKHFLLCVASYASSSVNFRIIWFCYYNRGKLLACSWQTKRNRKRDAEMKSSVSVLPLPVSPVLGFGTALCRRQEEDVSLYNGPGLSVSSQSLIQQSKPGSVASFEEPWLSCAPTCLSNRVQVFLNPEGYQPSLCRHLRSLTTHSWPKIQRDPVLPAACPAMHPLYPALLLTRSGFHWALALLCFAVLEGCCIVTTRWSCQRFPTAK